MKKCVIYFLFVGACVFLPSILFATDLPNGFVDVENFIPSIQIDIRYNTANNFVGRHIDGYESPRCILSYEAALALKNVQNELARFGLGLKIYDAYRPQSAVNHFVRWAKDTDDVAMKNRFYPNVDKRNLFREGYIAEKSSHSRGSTVDVTLVSFSKYGVEELDMGTTWDFFGPQSWPSYLHLTVEQRANRMLLQQVMTKYGFLPLREEWWHFTLKNEPYPNKYFNFPVK